MYIKKVEIKNIRSIHKMVWQAPARMLAGWHVVIGDNGSGKSTFLRSVVLALIGRFEAEALRQNWNDWLTKGEEGGEIRIEYALSKTAEKFLRASDPSFQGVNPPTGVSLLRQKDGLVEFKPLSQAPNIEEPSDFKRPFSASYGPFRRFSGGSQEYFTIFKSRPILAAHLSLFGEDVALTEYLSWLGDLQFKKLENRPEGELLESVKKFINQEGLLPYQVRLEKITSDGVEFVDGKGYNVSVNQLSDGYRSILSMTFELIRQLTSFYTWEKLFGEKDPGKIVAPGIVLIDEVDVHLHPTWQREVGIWFREHFPNIQFIVTTHSPLVCQAANVGTVWRLPRPGSQDLASQIKGIELDRLLYGNVLDAYGTEVFGKGVTRSDEAKKRLQLLAELNVKELRGGLEPEERKQQIKLRAAMPTTAHVTDASEEEDHEALA